MPRRRKKPPIWACIRKAALERAGHKCEECEAPNYAVLLQDSRVPMSLCDSYKEARANSLKYDDATIIIVLSVIRKDRLEINTTPTNLRVLCQRCHNAWTASHRGQLLRLKHYKFKDALDLKKQSRFGFAL